MVQSHLLTGDSGIGKTTALKKILDDLGLDHCGGFYTEAMCAAGEVYGYRIVVLGGQIGTLADMAYTTAPFRVGKYGVVIRFLEDIALTAVSQALVSKSFVVLDEIGPMHLCSPLFQTAVMGVLTSSVPLLGTLSSGSDPWLDELKQRSDVELHTLTRDNRGEVPSMLVKTLEQLKRVV
jgi:nucleoside-triphosphatase